MKKILNKYIIAAVFAGLFGLTSCEKDFLDVNTDPNAPTNASPDVVLPSGMLATAYTMGNQFQFTGNVWAQHWTQSYTANQYKELDKYQVSSATYDRPWQYLYAGALRDYKFVSDKAKGDSANYGAIADIMTAYTYQVIVDGWDRAPFTEALQGATNTTPRYDNGKDIYRALPAIIDRGLSKINTESPVHVGSEDLVFSGDMDMWRRFANTLKLKIYLRQVYEDPGYAETQIRALFNSPGVEFLGGNEDAEIKYIDATNNANPAYQVEILFSQAVNVVASQTAINYMTNTNDPRIDDLFDRPNGSATAAHVGIPQGAAGVPGAPATGKSSFSTPDANNILGPEAAVPFISGAESLFLQAEAALRYTGLGDAKALYNAGITASFDYWGRALPASFLTSATIDLDQATGTGIDGKLDRIITQKWVAMSGRQGFEAWTEIRRTGYPSFIAPSASSTLGPGRFPNRLPFANSEQTRNPNTPGIVDIHVPVWWDKK